MSVIQLPWGASAEAIERAARIAGWEPPAERRRRKALPPPPPPDLAAELPTEGRRGRPRLRLVTTPPTESDAMTKTR